MLNESVLESTKKILNIPYGVDAFDQDVLTHINAAFSTLSELGVFGEAGMAVVDDSDEWADYDLPLPWLQSIRTYVFLKVRLVFDPPTTSFLLEALTKQIQEYEWRISTMREYSIREEEEVVVDDE